MTNALLPAFGGPVGLHARRRGVFFRPLPWALLAGAVLFTVLYVRHLPCLTIDPANPINAYIRACYSDIPVVYTWQGWAAGGSPLGGDQLAVAPLLAIVLVFVLHFARLLGADIQPGASDVAQYAGVPAYFGASAILLFAAFLLFIVASALLARREGRPWDVFFVAASPVVLAAGLVNFDLLALALTALGLALLARDRSIEAGVALGAAASAATMPLAFVLGAAVALLLRRRSVRLAALGLAFAATWLLVHVPLLVRNFDAVYGYYHSEITKDVSYGSIWYLLQEVGIPFRELGAFTFVVSALLIGIVAAWLYVTGRTPSAGRVSAAVVLILVVLAPAYPPQTALWVMFAVFLARPVDVTAWALSGVQALHYLAVWGWLSGHLTAEKSGPEMVYVLAVMIRLAFELVLLYLVVRDLRSRSPQALRDALRAPQGPAGPVAEERAEHPYPVAEERAKHPYPSPGD
ncbi:glycosyltransferase 87 family protein [Tessaracoccus oleiagri]|uniref:Uncharacterized membrane protein n=1 Tax=Tessaracoccus oleiagri TaxID=686624 RepID=A0A1G9I212_9ACTN|nr:glycosyltransferase 87 family protein [Tessaracoccus oleiagri]SDL19122.1 Uncharacterized membrane protein [Tessaracoccus oleiagri]